MSEDILTGEWIVSTLEGDTGPGGLMETGSPKISGAYYGLIPPDKDLPAVRFHVQVPQDVRGVGTPTERIMVRLDWLIVVVREGHGLAAILPIVSRLDDLLHDANGETASIRVMSCVRLEPFTLLEAEESGVRYRHAGGLYRTLVQKK